MTTVRKVEKKKTSLAGGKKKVKVKSSLKKDKVVSKTISSKVKSKLKKVTPTKVTPVKEIGKYLETIGRRKTSRARVRLWVRGDKVILINDKSYKDYFPSFELQQIVTSPLTLMKMLDKFRIVVRVSGGGMHSQAEAVRHGIARALIEFNADFRKRLKRAGFLTRDPRMRERKKFGLKRARRAPQWQKR